MNSQILEISFSRFGILDDSSFFEIPNTVTFFCKPLKFRMACENIKVTSIKVLDNPASFTSDFKFEITFECAEDLEADLEWKLTYVGSADSETYDQILDSILVGPIPRGVHRFVFQAPCPDEKKIPKSNILGITVVFLSCLFNEKEFLRIGYYVNNVYEDPNAIYPEKIIPEAIIEEIDLTKEEIDHEEEEKEAEGELDEEDEDFVVDDSNIENEAQNENAYDKDVPEPKKIKLESHGDNLGLEDKNEREKTQEMIEEIPIPLNFDIAMVRRYVNDEKPKITRIPC